MSKEFQNGCATQHLKKPEGEQADFWYAAIEEGVAQADAGVFASPQDVAQFFLSWGVDIRTGQDALIVPTHKRS